MKGDTERFNIVRYFHPRLDKPAKVVRYNVTLDEAQRHCNDPKTKKEGVYFDGYRRTS